MKPGRIRGTQTGLRSVCEGLASILLGPETQETGRNDWSPARACCVARHTCGTGSLFSDDRVALKRSSGKSDPLHGRSNPCTLVTRGAAADNYDRVENVPCYSRLACVLENVWLQSDRVVHDCLRWIGHHRFCCRPNVVDASSEVKKSPSWPAAVPVGRPTAVSWP